MNHCHGELLILTGKSDGWSLVLDKIYPEEISQLILCVYVHMCASVYVRMHVCACVSVRARVRACVSA